MENAGASEDVNAGSQVEGTDETSATDGAGAGQGQETGEEATKGVTAGADGQAEGDIEVVEKDGKHFIPKERFDQIYGKMKEYASFFETIQSDPDARRQFVQSLNGGQQEESSEKGAPKEEERPTAFGQFLAETPALAQSPEHQALFGNFGKAIAADLESHLESNYMTKSEVQKIVAPLVRYIGDTETSRFYEKTPQAKAYQGKIVEVMKQHPTLSIAQAFKLASDTDEKLRAAGAFKAKQNQEKLNKTPITGKTHSGGGQTKNPLPRGDQGIAEGVARAFAKLGINE